MYSISVHIHICVKYSVWALYTPVPNKTKIELVEENQLSCNISHTQVATTSCLAHMVMMYIVIAKH